MGGAFGSGLIHILFTKVHEPASWPRSLWFSVNFESSIICFIISASFGWSVAALGTAAVEVAAVGEVEVACENAEGTMAAATATAKALAACLNLGRGRSFMAPSFFRSHARVK